MDLTDLDYKDLFRDAVNMMAHIARAAGFDPNDPTVEPPAIVARVENLRAEVERLTAELEEARLTWLAQRGNPKGAPSKGWACSFGRWTKDLPNGDKLVVEGGHWSVQHEWEDHATYQHWTIRRTAAGHMLMGWGEGVWGRSDRAAMKCADAAHPSTPPASPE